MENCSQVLGVKTKPRFGKLGGPRKAVPEALQRLKPLGLYEALETIYMEVRNHEAMGLRQLRTNTQTRCHPKEDERKGNPQNIEADARSRSSAKLAGILIAWCKEPERSNSHLKDGVTCYSLAQHMLS